MISSTNNKILIICPSRGKGHLIDSFYNNFQENSMMSDLVFSLDYDDEMNYRKYKAENVFYEIGFGRESTPAMNYVAHKYAQSNQYEFIGMLNDDHFIMTKNWDKIMYDDMIKNNILIAYPNDLDERSFVDPYTENLIAGARNSYASCVIMHRDIIRCLGYMGHPAFEHSYLDRLWLDLGKELNALKYYNDIIIKHDFEKYGMVHDYSNWKKDMETYKFYISNQLEGDVKMIKRYLNEK